MNNKLICLFILGLVLLVGCKEYNPRENFREVDSCDNCTDDERCWNSVDGGFSCEFYIEPTKCCPYEIDVTEDKEYISNDCHCLSEQNESYNYSKLHMTFEDKKHMAMIDDHWYCVCEEKYTLYHREYPMPLGYFLDCKAFDKECCTDCEDYIENRTETTEFIWSY